MKANKRKRFDKVDEALGQLPYKTRIANPAFLHFRATGELPDDDDRLAAALLERARRGGDASARPLSEVERILMRVDTGIPGRSKRRVRDYLFDEAMHRMPFIRHAARGAIRILVAIGGDVCDGEFGDDAGIPEYGTVGMHILDMPNNLGTPPYEERAKRLFQRIDALRDRIDYDDDGWWDPIEDALRAFWDEGTPPPEGLVGELVCAIAEYDCLWQHRKGEDVAEAMAALDRMAKSLTTDT